MSIYYKLRNSPKIRPRCRPTMGYDRALWTIYMHGCSQRHCTYFARCQIATHQSTRSTHRNLYHSTIIQTAWSTSAAACSVLLAVLVPSTGAYVNESFTCCRHVLHVSLPPHTHAMLVAPKRHIALTAYVEVGILQPCSVRHSQYLVMRERWALRSSLTPKCNMFCATTTRYACPKINPISRVWACFRVWNIRVTRAPENQGLPILVTHQC